jgi:hypothetical protein
MAKVKELERETETETETENKAVTTTDQKLPAAPATTREVDPFEAYADQVAPQNIVGTLLVFNKGDYLAGKSKVEIPAGTRFTAGMDLMAVGFVKWWSNRPAGGQRPAGSDRSSLGRRGSRAPGGEPARLRGQPSTMSPAPAGVIRPGLSAIGPKRTKVDFGPRWFVRF